MKVYNSRKFWEQGDSVIQDSYPGCPAVVESRSEKSIPGLGFVQSYMLIIDVRNHPEGVDENGEQVDYKSANYTEARLLACGN